MDWQSLGGQLINDKRGLSSYHPMYHGRNLGGRQFYSSKRPVSTKSHVADSFVQALEQDTFRYNEGGETYLISPQQVPDVENTYRLKVQSETDRGTQILQGSRTGNRKRTSEMSTPADADLRQSAKKIARINSQYRQFHHMMDLDSYAPFFQGLNDQSKAEMIGMLNSKGFYPCDDRRNYIGLGGNQWAKPGKGNTVGGIKGSEHQGQIHPMLSVNRKEYPLPAIDEIAVMSTTQRFETMLPHLLRDRAALQQVLNTRRPGISSRVSPAAQEFKDNYVNNLEYEQIIN